MLSTSLRVMVRPFKTYASLREPDSAAALTALRLLLVIGTLVAFTATGRLSPFEVASSMLGFAWIPIAQALGLAAALRLFARAVPFRRAYALYLESIGPMVVLFLTLAGLTALDVELRGNFLVYLMPGIVGATAWSTFLAGVMFAVALGLRPLRAALAAVVQLLVTYAFIFGYFLAAGQLWPILPR